MYDTGADSKKRRIETYKEDDGREQSKGESVSIHDKIKEEKNEPLVIHQRIVSSKNMVEKEFYKIGAYLKLIKDRGLYKQLGYETFNEYIAQPELQFQRSMVYSLIGVYTDFIESGKFQSSDIESIPYYSLDRIRQFKDDEDIGEWVLKARENSLSDLSKEIRIAKGGKETVYVPEKKSHTVTCPHCGKAFQWCI